jgi:putative colanic acid biosynthesis acetyltransferase WcaF
MEVRLDKFKHQNHQKKSKLTLGLWLVLGAVFIQSKFPFPIFFKKMILKLFGAKIGSNFIIKTGVIIKYPWKLHLGDNVWIGENVWIDNLDDITIHSNVCISQGALLLTGNHDYKKSDFALVTGKIIIEDGVWIGAKSVVCPNIICKKNSILTVGSILQMNTMENGIYQGNPATHKRYRF